MIHTYRWTGDLGSVGTRYDFAIYRPTSLTSARPCGASDLAASPSMGAGMGSSYGDLAVRNRSRSPCSLEGRPGLAMVDDRGIVWRSTSPVAASDKQLVLVPDSWADSNGWYIGGACGGYPRTTTLRVTLLPSRQSVSVPFPVGQREGPSSCTPDGPTVAPATPNPGTLTTSPFAPITHPQWQQLEQSLRQDQEVELLAPSQVGRGTLLHYTVRISARPKTGVPLWDSDCPLFRQTLGTTGPTYVLNCQPLQFLQNPHEAADFDMQVPVPADAALGPTTLSWQLVEPERSAISTAITITR